MESEDVVLKILHTADWHLGKRFRAFDREDELKLTRARLTAVETLLGLAQRHAVDAVLCAGDLFDNPRPDEEWWRGLARHLSEKGDPARPVFLLPGNHDPLLPGSIYSEDHEFRSLLPDWVHVVDRDDYEFELGGGAVLFAVPCRSQAGQLDPTGKLPPRPEGDSRLRIGMVHGQTFDIPGCQNNFPIKKEAAHALGLDYLAVGDTHSFREVPTGFEVPVVYPGTPEQTNFGEDEPGNVALIFFPRRPRAPRVRAESVGHYTWERVRVGSIEEMRALTGRNDLTRRVLQITLNLCVSLEEAQELDARLRELSGDQAINGKASVVVVETERVEIQTGDFDELFDELPPVIQRTITRLRELESDENEAAGAQATRALRHLYQTLKRPGAAA